MIELLVTMLILTVVLMGLAALQIGTIRQVTASRRANEATRLCGRIIEQYRFTPLTDLTSTLTTDGSWHPVWGNSGTTQLKAVGADGQSDGPFSVYYMVESGLGSSWIITVQVRWKDVRPSNEQSDMTKKYQEFNVTMSCRRYI